MRKAEIVGGLGLALIGGAILVLLPGQQWAFVLLAIGIALAVYGAREGIRDLGQKNKETQHAQQIAECAQMLRNFAANQRQKQPNTLCIPKDRMKMQLGPYADLVDEVIDFMEQKGWAAKVKFPADCWDIR